MDGRRILIFCETKKGCDAVTRQLRMDGWPALSIHGDKSQHERDWVLAEFKAGKCGGRRSRSMAQAMLCLQRQPPAARAMCDCVRVGWACDLQRVPCTLTGRFAASTLQASTPS